MTVRRIDLSEFPKALEEFSGMHISNIKKGVTSGIARSLVDLVQASPVDTGLYAQSWDFTADETKAVLGNYAPHAPIIEFGARPFTPPMRPLLEWAKRVLKDPSQPPKFSSPVWALATATRNKIMDQGIKPRHILQNMIPKIIENIKEELRNAS